MVMLRPRQLTLNEERKYFTVIVQLWMWFGGDAHSVFSAQNTIPAIFTTNYLIWKIYIKSQVRLKHTANRLWVSSLTTSPELCIYQNIDLLTFTRKRIFEDHIRLILKLLRADHLITAINLSLKNCCCVLCIGRSNLGIQNSLERAIYLTRRRRKAL